MGNTIAEGDFQALAEPVSAEDRGAGALTPISNYTTFHHFIELPFEIQSQIRIEACEEAVLDSDSGVSEQRSCRLALVCKDWQHDIEKILFSQIRVDPSNEEEVLRFKELFTDKRKAYLTRLDIAIDDDFDGPWHQEKGLLRISQVMTKIGHFLQYIDGCDMIVCSKSTIPRLSQNHVFQRRLATELHCCPGVAKPT
ncbi:hypothetical protein F5883DRAFT_201377 [Diaporthe sp. PMI_573]|nr:hypothetical protein F5883DRAFT_201377 [Diaporthaceae sp. PMI_573]